MTHRRHPWEDDDVEAEHGDPVREGPAASSASRSGRTRRHSWEDDADAFVERVREEGYAVGAGDSDDDSEASASDWEIPESTFEDEFVAELLELYLIRVLNARQFCSLCFRASKAGVSAATKYAFDPPKTFTPEMFNAT